MCGALPWGVIAVRRNFISPPPAGRTVDSARVGLIGRSEPGERDFSLGTFPGPAVFKIAFQVVLVPPPAGGPGEGPDCHFPKEIDDLGPMLTRIRGVI